jgi:hypothetical protein
VRALDRPNGPYDFLIFQRRNAAYSVPGKHEFHDHIRINDMPKQVTSERGDGRVALSLSNALAHEGLPLGQDVPM